MPIFGLSVARMSLKSLFGAHSHPQATKADAPAKSKSGDPGKLVKRKSRPARAQSGRINRGRKTHDGLFQKRVKLYFSDMPCYVFIAYGLIILVFSQASIHVRLFAIMNTL
jgi:hypothetical protein